MSFRRVVIGLSVPLVFGVVGVSAGAGASGGPSVRGSELSSTGETDAGAAPYGGTIVDRSRGSNEHGDHQGDHGNSGNKSQTNPTLNKSFMGLNFFQQRYANNGNQFSVEPPDQGLCTGNGYVFEVVNDVINVFNQSGQTVLPDNANTVGGKPTDVNHAVDLNTFFGYPAAIDRATGIPAGPHRSGLSLRSSHAPLVRGHPDARRVPGHGPDDRQEPLRHRRKQGPEPGAALELDHPQGARAERRHRRDAEPSLQPWRSAGDRTPADESHRVHRGLSAPWDGRQRRLHHRERVRLLRRRVPEREHLRVLQEEAHRW